MKSCPINYDAIMRAAYEGVSHRARWLDAMVMMRDVVGGCQATYLTTSRKTGAVSVEEITRPDSSLRAAYLAHYWPLDPIRERLLVHGAPKGVWLNDEYFLGVRGRQRHPFYQELLRPHGLGPMLSIPLFDNGDIIAALTFQADAKADGFSAAHTELLTPLVQHLLTSAKLRERLHHLSYRASLSEAVLDRFAMPLFIVNAAGRQLYANRRAERWLEQQGNPAFDSGGAVGTHALGQNIRRLASRLCAEREAMDPAFETAVVDKASGTAMVGLPLPLAHAAPFGMHEPVCLLLLCVQALHDNEQAADIIADLFGLTRAEHRLVHALSRSSNVVQAARLLGVAHATARTQLASVFSKTGCATQAELARLLAGLSHFGTAQ